MIRLINLTILATLLTAWRPVQAESTTVWVERDQYHTAVLIPTTDARQLPGVAERLAKDHQAQGYTRFGWGDRDYYGARQQSPKMAAKALLLPTRSVIEVSFHSGDTAPENSIAVELTGAELERLKRYIHRSFRMGQNGQPRFVRRNSNERYYYVANGRYHLLNNCNHWTAEALRRAGMKINRRPLMLAKALVKQISAERKQPAEIAVAGP